MNIPKRSCTNQEVSPAVLRRIGIGNVVVVATPDKLRHTPELHVDTGDPELDREFAAKEYLFVLVGYRARRLHPIGRGGGELAADQDPRVAGVRRPLYDRG